MQHAMGIGLSSKDLSGWGINAASFPITGFFGHSNDLAVYLFWPLLVGVGLFAAIRSWCKIPYLVLTLLFLSSIVLDDLPQHAPDGGNRGHAHIISSPFLPWEAIFLAVATGVG